MEKIILSQSFIKRYIQYKRDRNECGKKVFHIYYKGLKMEPTKAMKIGQYFEFLATGAKPAHGDPIPTPELKKTNPGKGLPLKDWQTAIQQAAKFKEYIEKKGITIQKVGRRITKRKRDFIASGVLDLEAMFQGREIIIDLKFSGLYEDNFSPLGWGLRGLEWTNQKEERFLQSIHYSFLSIGKDHPNGKPFFYWVFDSKSLRSKLIEVQIDPETIKEHELNLANFHSIIYKDIWENGEFEAIPSFDRCADCPLADNCEHFQDTPDIFTIQI